MGFATRHSRGVIEAAGYYLKRRDMLPYGVDYLLDVRRLSAAWGCSIHTFFDVGANIGDTSAAALDNFKEANVLAFEPSTDTFAKLQDRLGGNPRFSCQKIALSNAEGETTFHEYELSLWNSMIPNPPDRPGVSVVPKIITVPCTTIDVFCKQRGIAEIDILKTDAEGCDLLVLQGAKAMLPRTRFVYFEFNNQPLGPFLELLSAFGFRLIGTYVDRIEPETMFIVANALFARSPSGTPKG